MKVSSVTDLVHGNNRGHLWEETPTVDKSNPADSPRSLPVAVENASLRKNELEEEGSEGGWTCRSVGFGGGGRRLRVGGC